MSLRRACFMVLLGGAGAVFGACSSSSTDVRSSPSATAVDAGAGGGGSGGNGGAAGAGGSSSPCTEAVPDGGAGVTTRGAAGGAFTGCAAHSSFIRRFGRFASTDGFELAFDGLCGVAFAGFYTASDAPLELEPGAPTHGLVVGKLAQNGALLWQRALAVPEPKTVSLSAAPTGEVYLTVFAGAPIDFGSGPMACGHCLVKYDPAGAVLWAKALDGIGNGSTETKLLLGADGSGNLYAAGALWGTLDFGLGPMTSNALRDAFVLGLDPNGAVLWQRRLGGPQEQYATAIGVSEAGNVAVAGHAIDPATGLTSAFYASLAPNGQVRFTHQDAATAKQQTRATRVAVGASEEVVVVVEPAAATGASTLLALAADGSKRWDHRLDLRVTGLGLDSAERALVVGEPGPCSLDFGGGALLPAGGAEGAYALFDPKGAHLVSRRFRGVPEAFALEPSGAMALVGGGRGGPIDLGDGLAVTVADEVTSFAARTRP